MTRRFTAHFTNGVIVPDEILELPQNSRITVTVEDAEVETPVRAPLSGLPRFDDPMDPMPPGGVEMVDWWRRHALPIDPIIGRKIAQAKAYEYDEEPDDDS